MDPFIARMRKGRREKAQDLPGVAELGRAGLRTCCGPTPHLWAWHATAPPPPPLGLGDLGGLQILVGPGDTKEQNGSR